MLSTDRTVWYRVIRPNAAGSEPRAAALCLWSSPSRPSADYIRHVKLAATISHSHSHNSSVMLRCYLLLSSFTISKQSINISLSQRRAELLPKQTPQNKPLLPVGLMKKEALQDVRLCLQSAQKPKVFIQTRSLLLTESTEACRRVYKASVWRENRRNTTGRWILMQGEGLQRLPAGCQGQLEGKHTQVWCYNTTV